MPDREAFGRTVSALARAGVRETGPLGTRLLWQDRSGSQVAVFVSEGGAIECAKPTFAAVSRVMVRPTHSFPDPQGCAFCAIAGVEVLEDGEMAYPLAVELDDIHLGMQVASDEPVAPALSAFAEQIEVWPDVSAYDASKASAGVGHLAARSLIPSGLFGPGGTEQPTRAEAVISGVVTACERKTNGYSGRPFDWCRLETYAASVDVVAEARSEPLTLGAVVQGTFWLVGRRVDRPPAAQSTRRRRGFRR